MGKRNKCKQCGKELTWHWIYNEDGKFCGHECYFKWKDRKQC